MKKYCLLILLFAALTTCAQTPANKLCVIGYYDGDAATIDAYPVEKLTHIIFSFCHLQGDQLHVQNQKDTLTIQHLVELKKRNPTLKVILSIGGWGGCETCSQVFSTGDARKDFAHSVKLISQYFKTDGIDIDWEYPVIEGFPNHQHLPQDKADFTALLQTLRDTLSTKYEISFAAGGFETYLQQSVDWSAIAPLVDKVNLMSYDLINGNSTVTGNHTPLYSTPEQIESVDNGVRYLDSIHFPLNKIVIGAAFYGKLFNVNSMNSSNGLYESGSFDRGISFKDVKRPVMEQQGYVFYWDDTAKAPTMYNKATHQFFTYDNRRSIQLKTQYAMDKKLNGIMFWQLGDDKPRDGLLTVIYNTIQNNNH